MRWVHRAGSLGLVKGPHFRLDRIDGAPSPEAARLYAGAPLLVTPIDGALKLASETIEPGACGLLGKIEDLSAPLARAR